MKQLRIFSLLLALSTASAVRTYAGTNQWGGEVFGARLSIALTNNIFPIGSRILLTCITTNFSTNNVCFIRTESRGMYEVSLIDNKGEIVEINNPDDAGDSSEKMGGVKSGESFECPIPLLFDGKVQAGHYKLIAKQRVFLIKDIDRKNAPRGELVSNPLDIEVK